MSWEQEQDWPLLAFVPEPAGQIERLQEFRAAQPHVIIGMTDEHGAWQARIPESSGETVITRHSLRELLDKLDKLLAAPEGHREPIS